MRLVQSDSLACFQFPALAQMPGFFHGVFIGKPLAGQGRTTTFDLGLGHGTPEDTVWRNRQQMIDFFSSAYRGAYVRQVHGSDVCRVSRPMTDTDAPIQLSGDAIMTDRAGVGLVIQVADCQPVIIVDPVTRAVANVHSGWRGSLQNIIGATVDRMVVEYKTRPEDLVCGIGPSLGPCCAEFVNYKEEIPAEYWGYRSDNNHFDFWQISIDQLTNAGVRTGNIGLAGICTKCNRHMLFSYRGEKHTGRFAAVVGIRPVQGVDDESA